MSNSSENLFNFVFECIRYSNVLLHVENNFAAIAETQ
jgi:hypothetical protein